MDLHGCGESEMDGTGVNDALHFKWTHKAGCKLAKLSPKRKVFGFEPPFLTWSVDGSRCSVPVRLPSSEKPGAAQGRLSSISFHIS